jgi:hypothetical protein
MAIYRGPGGAGDATADATNAASVAEDFADASAASASAASGSAATASAAATAAGAAQTAAEAAQLAAETAETNAETAETNAETAQTAAEAAQTAAEAAQTAAELAETNAETAETGALAAQSAAEAAQTAAELAETNAETAETNAVAAQTAAEAARDSALAAYDNFDDRYLGAKTADPTLDNDGDALVAGALYFNSVAGAMRVYTGTVWVDAYSSGTTFLAKANNLSDLPNASTARTNLGLAIGVDVQAYDATILKSADIGVTVQGYDADTAKLDVAQSFTEKQTFNSNIDTDQINEKTSAAGVTIDGVLLKDTTITANTIKASGTSSTQGEVQLFEDTDNGTNYVAIKAPASIASDVTWTLPNADGTADQVLKTDGSGALGWATAGGASNLGDGSATTPSVNFASDTNTGIYRPGDDRLGFATNGALVGEFDGTNLKFNSGYGSVATAYGCRAWVGFNGTGTPAIIGSGNVSSITDNGTGDFTINFTTALSDANYATTGMSSDTPTINTVMAVYNGFTTTTAVRVQTFRPSQSDGLVDRAYNSVLIHR